LSVNAQQAAEERKEKLTDRLSTQYSMNHISLEEYERLIKYSQNLETDKELTILEKIIEGYDRPAVNNYNNERQESQSGFKSADNYADNIPQNHFTLLSSRNTSGPLTVGNFVNVLSSHKIVINEEDLINSETILNFMVVLGDVVIYVPENVNVISRVIPLIAEMKIDKNIRNRGGKKDLVITGNVILGEIKIKVNKN